MKSDVVEVENLERAEMLKLRVVNESLLVEGGERRRAAAYFELTKPRITLLILLVFAAGFALGALRGGAGKLNYLSFAEALVGVALLSSGVAALNQFIERDTDALMRRTMSRPLPASVLSPKQALIFGVGLIIFAEIYLAFFVNLLTAALGVSVIVGYLLCYTPLKTRTSLSTMIGAFPGGMPPLMGWTAARGAISFESLVLFAILFVWQFPHFFAIAWMYREDYRRAGIRMLPVIEADGLMTGLQMVIWTMILIPISLLPTLIGLAGRVYFIGAMILGLLYLTTSVIAATKRTRQNARRVLLASVIYLPLLFALMVLNK
jgi:protoheme IX farnesyltransferase